ncbi:MAG: hypothetical protein ACOC56_04765 [Atribacterota bacterium]
MLLNQIKKKIIFILLAIMFFIMAFYGFNGKYNFTENWLICYFSEYISHHGYKIFLFFAALEFLGLNVFVGSKLTLSVDRDKHIFSFSIYNGGKKIYI